jgi:hypothetical protein
MTNAPLISRRDHLVAKQVAQRLPMLMSNHHLKPAFSNFFITAYLGIPIFIAVLDTALIGDHTRYIHAETLHQISTDLGGRKVYLSNSTGIRYIILLGPLPKLPRSVELPGDIPRGIVTLGVRLDGAPIQIPWSRLGHLLIVGMTGSGKSVMLRSLAMQAIRNDILLGLADIDQTTFAMLEDHPLLFAPIAGSPTEALELIQKALEECDIRAGLFKQMDGYPENIDEYNAAAIKMVKEPLKRLLIILDESSAVLQAMGGSTGEMAGKLAALGWRGRKFGIHFVFGAQEFTKQLVGAVREQVNLTIAFRVKPTASHMAKAIGCDGAHRIPANRPGMAIVDRYGPIQAYYIPKPLMLAAGVVPTATSTLPDFERDLFVRALEQTDGKITLGNIMEWGQVSQHQARKLQSTWAVRGWIAKDASRDNSFCVAPKTRDLVANRQTPQTPTNGLKRSQTHTNQEKGEKTYEK